MIQAKMDQKEYFWVISGETARGEHQVHQMMCSSYDAFMRTSGILNEMVSHIIWNELSALSKLSIVRPTRSI